MSYKIVYGPDKAYEAKTDPSRARLRLLTASFLLAGCLLARTFWPEGTALLRSVLLPGNPTVTELAFLDMMEDLRTGEPINESLSVFCKTIVSDNDGRAS